MGADTEGQRPPRVSMLLGKPPERSPVLPEIVACLRDRGADVSVHVARAGEPLPRTLFDADVVALRGLRRSVLAEVVALERQGVRCCNPAHATLLTRDRDAVQQALAAAGLPVPRAATVADAADARAWAAGRPVVVKARDVDAGRGAGVVLWERPGDSPPPPTPGPYVVQERVPGDGVDRKVYVAGSLLGGLLKPAGAGRRTGTPFEPTKRMATVALAVGEALRLTVYGVDLVDGPDGPVVVDVNAFPSCDGVPGAAATIAETLLTSAR